MSCRWQSEAVYINELSDGFTARRVIKQWIGFYNTQRPHTAHGGRTPDQTYGLGRAEQNIKQAA